MKIITRDVPPRAAWALEQAGVAPLLARLFAARGVTSADELDDGLGRLLPPAGLRGAADAARLLAAETATDARTIAQGMQMVRAQLQRFLSECGVEEIKTEGLAFDPNVHEAISQEPSPDKPEGTILAQRRKGYKLRDRLLRPAAVVVAHTPPTP